MKYRARYLDPNGKHHVREFYAVHVVQANRKASGIGKSNGWRLVSVGQI